MSVAWGAWLSLPSNPLIVAGTDVAQLMVKGLLDGTDAQGPYGWGRIGDRDQRIVEAAELATGLWLGRERLVPALGARGLSQVLRWLAGVHGRMTYDDNWVLFPSIVATVQRAFGQAVPDPLIDTGVDKALSWYRGDGWYTDGPGCAFDSYTGWAIHWHLLLWARLDGGRRPRVRRLVEDRARVYLRGIAPTVASNGSRPLFGRSLGYRFAAVAPLALAALLDLDAVRPGLARRIASGVVRWHLEQGALDPETGWLRRGVGAERPDVCERYMSAGAVAWAAHALVALGLPASAPFWSACEEPLPVEQGDGRLALRGPGFLFGWHRSTGETWLVNAKSGHPDDIPGHDYTAYYGKFEYRSHFPFSVRTATGCPGPDSAVVLTSREGSSHRGVTERGGVGPGWAWAEYALDPSARPGRPPPGEPTPRASVLDAAHRAQLHRLTTVVLPWRHVMVRLTGVRPRARVQLTEGPPVLTTDRSDQVVRWWAAEQRWAAAASPERTVAIRALSGYDVLVPSGPAGRGPDLNLIAPHAEQPVVTESSASHRPRLLASATYATASPRRSLDELEAVDVRALGRWTVEVALADEETAIAYLGRGTLPSTMIAGRPVEGRLRVIRARTDGSRYEGEAIGAIQDVIRLDRPGPVSVCRDRDEVEVTTTEGFALEPGWIPRGLSRMAFAADGVWHEIGRLDPLGVVSTALIRRLQRRTGGQFITLRLTR